MTVAALASTSAGIAAFFLASIGSLGTARAYARVARRGVRSIERNIV